MNNKPVQQDDHGHPRDEAGRDPDQPPQLGENDDQPPQPVDGNRGPGHRPDTPDSAPT